MFKVTNHEDALLKNQGSTLCICRSFPHTLGLTNCWNIWTGSEATVPSTVTKLVHMDLRDWVILACVPWQINMRDWCMGEGLQGLRSKSASFQKINSWWGQQRAERVFVLCLFVAALLPLHTEAEWEEVKKTISSQEQDSSISDEFYKVSKY